MGAETVIGARDYPARSRSVACATTLMAHHPYLWARARSGGSRTCFFCTGGPMSSLLPFGSAYTT